MTIVTWLPSWNTGEISSLRGYRSGTGGRWRSLRGYPAEIQVDIIVTWLPFRDRWEMTIVTWLPSWNTGRYHCYVVTVQGQVGDDDRYVVTQLKYRWDIIVTWLPFMDRWEMKYTIVTWLPSWNTGEISLLRGYRSETGGRWRSLRGYPAEIQVTYHCYVVTQLKYRWDIIVTWLPSWNIDEISLLRGYLAKKQVRYHCYVVTELKNRRDIAIVTWLPSWKTGEILPLLRGYPAEKQVRYCTCYVVIRLKNRWDIVIVTWLSSWNIGEISLLHGYPAEI